MIRLCLSAIICSLPCIVESTTHLDGSSESLLRSAQSWLQQEKWLQQQKDEPQMKSQRSPSRQFKERDTTTFLATDPASRSGKDHGTHNKRDWYLSKLKAPTSLFQRQMKSIKRAWTSAAGKYAPRDSKKPSLDFPTRPTVLFFLILWLFVLALIWASPVPVKFKRLHAEHIMSTLHSIIAGSAGISVWLWETPNCSLEHPQRHWIRLMMLVSVSYFIADVFSMVVTSVFKRWRSVDLPMLLHHCFVIGTYSWVAENNVVLWFASSLLVNAVSVGPLNVVRFLRYGGMQHSVVYKAAGTVLIITFFWSRIVLIPWSLILFHSHEYCYKELTWVSNAALLSYGVVYILNIWWFFKIGKGAAKALASSGKSSRPTLKPVKGSKFLDTDYAADMDEPAATSHHEDPHSRTDPSGPD